MYYSLCLSVVTWGGPNTTCTVAAILAYFVCGVTRGVPPGVWVEPWYTVEVPLLIGVFGSTSNILLVEVVAE